MNEDASTFDLPEYIHSRLNPQILIEFPSRDEERRILEANLPFADAQILDWVADFLQRAHRAKEPFTVRDGINVGRYALKLGKAGFTPPLERSVRLILGEEALVYLET